MNHFRRCSPSICLQADRGDRPSRFLLFPRPAASLRVAIRRRQNAPRTGGLSVRKEYGRVDGLIHCDGHSVPRAQRRT